MTERTKDLVLVDLHGPVLKLPNGGISSHHYIQRPILDDRMSELWKASLVELKQEVVRLDFSSSCGIIYEDECIVRPPFNNLFRYVEDMMVRYDYFDKYAFDPKATTAFKNFTEYGIPWEYQTAMEITWAQTLADELQKFGVMAGRGAMRAHTSKNPAETKVANVIRHAREGRKMVIVEDDPYLAASFFAVTDTIDVCLIHDRESAERITRDNRTAVPSSNIQALVDPTKFHYAKSLTDIREMFFPKVYGFC